MKVCFPDIRNAHAVRTDIQWNQNEIKVEKKFKKQQKDH